MFHAAVLPLMILFNQGVPPHIGILVTFCTVINKLSALVTTINNVVPQILAEINAMLDSRAVESGFATQCLINSFIKAAMDSLRLRNCFALLSRRHHV